MKKIFFIFVWYILSLEYIFATDRWWESWVFWSGISWGQLRYWEIHTDDIPLMIRWAINFLLWISGTVAVIFIIVWAYKILFSWFESDKSAGKNTIIMALTWFAIASLAWVIISFMLENLERGAMWAL